MEKSPYRDTTAPPFDDHPELDPAFDAPRESDVPNPLADNPKLAAQAVPQPATMQEFIYGPDYVDEHIAVQSAGQTTLVIQDPGYNVVALVDFLGDGLAYQSLQTPYGHFHYVENGAGQPIDTAVHHNATTTGLWYPFWHKGKWFDQEIYSYHYVNRFYPITLGRFAQTDPNGQALVLSSAMLRNAQSPDAIAEFDCMLQYADGGGLYQAFASNPNMRNDPSGLISIDSAFSPHNWFTELGAANRAISSASETQDLLWSLDYGDDDYGEAMMDVLADRDFALGTLMHAVQRAKQGRRQANAYAEGAVQWMMEMAAMSPEMQVLSALPFAVGRGVRGLSTGVGFARQSRFNARARQSGRFGNLRGICFAAGTLVLMADGSLRPIETVRQSEMVACDLDPAENDGPEACAVTQTFARDAEEVIDLVLVSGNDRLTITTTEEHPFYLPSIGEYVEAERLSPGTDLALHAGRPWTVQAVDRSPANGLRVYNLEVADGNNYYVSPARVLVHNQCDALAMRPKGVPGNWQAKPSRTGGGIKWVDPTNPHNSVRVMPGNPNSPFTNSRQPYVRWQRNGQALDVNGNPVPTNSSAAHIPLGDFQYK